MIILISARAGTHREYLSILARIALLLKNQTFRENIIAAGSPKEIYRIIKGT